MALFLSDNVSGACPEVMEAIVAANSGAVLSYGDDAISASLQARLAEVFETEVKVFLTVTGTASNALALSALTPPYGKVYCHQLAHINTDECAAPELFTGGAKLVALRGENCKISSPGLAASISGRGNLHNAQPAVVSITQSTEAGTVYQLDEITAITATAREHGLKVHMDGARFTNGLVALDVSPAQMTWQAGVDVLSFGGTKNGCLAAEAIVFFDTALAQDFAYLHKRSGQLLSKMRFVAAQLQAYLHGGVWLRNARQANAMAARLSAGLAALPGIELAYPTQSNEVFVRLPAIVLEGLQAEGIAVNGGELDGTAERFVAAWNTSTVEVDNLLGAIARYCTGSGRAEADEPGD